MVAAATLKSDSITQGCICASNVGTDMQRWTKPRLYSFYKDLDGSKVKFPSVVCQES